MTKATVDALNQRISDGLERAGLGAYAWEPAPTCPQSHAQPDAQIGDLCYECSGINASNEEYYPERAEEFAAHPEWRIGRVARDFTRPENLIPAMEAWIAQAPDQRDIKIGWDYEAQHWYAAFVTYQPQFKVFRGSSENSCMLAEARAFAAALAEARDD